MNDQTTPDQTHLSAARQQSQSPSWLSERFQTIVIVVLLCTLSALVAYQAGKPATPAAVAGVKAISDREAQHRLIALEEEVKLLKADLVPEKEPHPIFAGLVAVLKFVEDHLSMLTLAGGIVFAFIIYRYYDIDFYFGTYREIANKKKLSEFHRKLGDRLMILNEWESAEAAYREALEINPSDIAASRGIAKASVFQPLKGQNYVPAFLIDIKLDSLIDDKLSPDAQLLYLKGLNRRDQGDEAASRALYQQAIEINPKYVGPYISLGFSLMGENEIEQAFSCFKKAFALDKSYPLANANLGICHLLTLQLDEAIHCFELSQQGSPSLFAMLGLGDAHRYRGNAKEALRIHAFACSVLERKDIEKDRYVSNDYLRNFMPLAKGDTKTIRRFVRASSFPEKKTIALYSLAIDQALNGELAQANHTYAKAAALDKDGTYQPFVANHIQATLQLTTVTPEAEAWLKEKLHQHASPAPQ